jgi:hypothetical protein
VKITWKEYLVRHDPRDHYTFNPERQPDSDIWDAAERRIHLHRKFGYDLPKEVYVMRHLEEIPDGVDCLRRDLADSLLDGLLDRLRDLYDLDGHEDWIAEAAKEGIDGGGGAVAPAMGSFWTTWLEIDCPPEWWEAQIALTPAYGGDQ